MDAFARITPVKIINTKQTQIAGLKECVGPAVQNTGPNDWEIRLVNKNKHCFCKLKIFLPTLFPTEAPHLYLDPPLSHSVVDSHGTILWPPELVGWSQYTSQLGPIVRSILHKFVTEPIKQQTHEITQISPVRRASTSSNNNYVSKIPTCPFDVEYVSGISPAECESLLKYSEARRLKVFDTDEMTEALKYLNSVIESNSLLLNEIEAYQDNIETKKTESDEIWDTLSQKRKELAELEGQHAEICKKYDPSVLISQLSQAAHSDDRNAEEIRVSYEKGEIDFNKFRDSFFTKRCAYHTKMAKIALLKRHNLKT